MSNLEKILNKYHLQDLTAESTPSVFVRNKDYDLFIIRYWSLDRQSLSTKSQGYLFKDGKIYHFNKRKEKFIELDKSYTSLYLELNRFYEANKNLVAQFSDEVDDLEDSLFERSIPRYFMDRWFELKRDLSRIERYYERNISVFKEFMKKYDANFGENQSDFQDIHDEIFVTINNIKGHLSRLDSIHHYYTSIKNDRLNKNLYLLTVLSAVFLPLNLIVGFFGMNTQNLFFNDNPDGTMLVLYTIGGVFLCSILGLRLIKLIDHYLLRFIFKRSRLYQGLIDRIHSLDGQ